MKPAMHWLPDAWQWLVDKVRQLTASTIESPRRLSQPISSPPLRALPVIAYAAAVIPALDKAKRIADVVAYALADPETAQDIVIDDSSINSTVAPARQAVATVLTSSMLGKGASIHDGVAP